MTAYVFKTKCMNNKIKTTKIIITAIKYFLCSVLKWMKWIGQWYIPLIWVNINKRRTIEINAASMPIVNGLSLNAEPIAAPVMENIPSLGWTVGAALTGSTGAETSAEVLTRPVGNWFGAAGVTINLEIGVCVLVLLWKLKSWIFKKIRKYSFLVCA